MTPPLRRFQPLSAAWRKPRETPALALFPANSLWTSINGIWPFSPQNSLSPGHFSPRLWTRCFREPQARFEKSYAINGLRVVPKGQFYCVNAYPDRVKKRACRVHISEAQS